MRLRWWDTLCLAVIFSVAVGAAGRDTTLIDAVKKGDTETLRTLLQRVDPNAADVDGTTPLHWAVQRDDHEMTRLLLGAGANAKNVNRYGVSALSLACTNGNGSIVEMLLTAGADPNTELPEGETALMTAARTGDPTAVRVLLDHGANPNAKERFLGQTALMWAVAQKHPKIAEMLIAAGADVHTRSTAGFTPLLFAVRAGDQEATGLLLRSGANVNAVAPDGTTMLAVAMINAHYELAAYVLNNGADPNIDGPLGTALHALVRSRNPYITTVPDPIPTGNLDSLELAAALLAHGADPNARLTKQPRGTVYISLVGATPFLLAAKAGDAALMRLLVTAGANPLIPTVENTSPLLAAAGVGHDEGTNPGSEIAALEAVKLAFELGADVAAVNDFGDTALHGAALRGANSVVQFLVDKGADLRARNKRGWTPETVASGVFIGMNIKAHYETADFIRKLLADADAPRQPR
jgi:ankyrin repeat protein